MKEIANLYHKDVVCETDGATTHLVMVANLFGRGSVHFAKLRNMKLAGTSVSTSAGKFYAFFDGVRGKALTEFFHCPMNTTNVGTDRMVAVARFAVFVQPSQHPPPSLPPSPPDSDAEDDEQEQPPPPPPPPPPEPATPKTPPPPDCREAYEVDFTWEYWGSDGGIPAGCQCTRCRNIRCGPPPTAHR